MTLQEAIETVENGEFWNECIIPGDNGAVLKFHKALDIMIAELQAKREPVKLTRRNRLTSDNVFEMNMHQLALNQVYIGQDGWVRYRNGPEDEVSVCDLIRTAAETLGVELPILSDDELSDLLTDWLQYGAKEPEGVLAILYRALCAMAEVRANLYRYEDAWAELERRINGG